MKKLELLFIISAHLKNTKLNASKYKNKQYKNQRSGIQFEESEVKLITAKKKINIYLNLIISTPVNK